MDVREGKESDRWWVNVEWKVCVSIIENPTQPHCNFKGEASQEICSSLLHSFLQLGCSHLHLFYYCMFPPLRFISLLLTFEIAVNRKHLVLDIWMC